MVPSLCLKIYIFSDNFNNLNNFDLFRAEAEQAVKGETKVKIIFISCIFLSQFFAHVYFDSLYSGMRSYQGNEDKFLY